MNRFNPGDTFDGNMDGVQSASADGVACGPTTPLCPAPIVVGNNRFGRVFIPLPDVNASFDALITQLSHSFARGLSVSALYTWSHSIDFSSYEIGFQQTDPFTQSINKGNSYFDVRQNLGISAYSELPLYRGRHDFLGAVAGGWTLVGLFSQPTGLPFSHLTGSCGNNHDLKGDGTCPDMPIVYTRGQITPPSKPAWQNCMLPN